MKRRKCCNGWSLRKPKIESSWSLAKCWRQWSRRRNIWPCISVSKPSKLERFTGMFSTTTALKPLFPVWLLLAQWRLANQVGNHLSVADSVPCVSCRQTITLAVFPYTMMASLTMMMICPQLTTLIPTHSTLILQHTPLRPFLNSIWYVSDGVSLVKVYFRFLNTCFWLHSSPTDIQLSFYLELWPSQNFFVCRALTFLLCLFNYNKVLPARTRLATIIFNLAKNVFLLINYCL